jgi:DNA-binding HxlR family transcriptional regulator
MANQVLEKNYTLQGIDATLVIIGGKWKIQILWSLRSKAKRFSEIKEEVHGITQKMLTQQLKEFVKDGIIPPRVEYKLTDYVKTLVPVLDTLNKWGDLHLGKAKPSPAQQAKEAVKTQQLGLF